MTNHLLFLLNLDDGELSEDKIAKYLALPIEIVKKLADSLQLA